MWLLLSLGFDDLDLFALIVVNISSVVLAFLFSTIRGIVLLRRLLKEPFELALFLVLGGT